MPLRPGDDAVAALGTLAAKGIRLVLTDMTGDVVLKLAAAGKPAEQTIFNVAAPDDKLRGGGLPGEYDPCRTQPRDAG